MEIKQYDKTALEGHTGASRRPSINTQLAGHWTSNFSQSLKAEKTGLPYSLEGCALNAVRKDGALYVIGVYADVSSRSFGNHRIRATEWHSYKTFQAEAAGVHMQAIGGMKLFSSWNKDISETAWNCFNSLADANASAETSWAVLDVVRALEAIYAGGTPLPDNVANKAHLQQDGGFFESSAFAGVVYTRPAKALEAFTVTDARLKEELTEAGFVATDLENASEWVMAEAGLDTSLFNERKRWEDWLRWLEVNGQKVRPYRGVNQRGSRAIRKAIKGDWT
jgi:peptide methionine sulfoxide reductase MsrB